MNLFMFYIGGDVQGSNIELHDIRFSIGENPEDCYEDLRRQWWGIPKSLHIDCWAGVGYADGHDISLKQEPFEGVDKLFFLNLGGYDGIEFGELHKNILLVAETPHKAIHKALLAMRHWKLPHKDAVFEIEKILPVSDLFEKNGFHVHLSKTEQEKPFEFTTKYTRINA